MDPVRPARPLGEKALLRLAFGLAAVVALGGAGLYVVLGRPEVPGASTTLGPTATTEVAAHEGADVQAMIGQLEAQLQSTPEDVDGWRMLGWSYFQTGRFAEAAGAYGRAAALDPADSEHLSAQGESLVQAAGGQITPAALTAFRNAVRVNPADPRARYFLAVEMDQRGDREGAMAAWVGLINSAPDGAPWATEVRTFVEDLARERGQDISDRLRPAAAAPASVAPGRPGPTTAQVAEAQAMAPADRQAMIRGMVDGLEARLAASPRDRDGWEQLMRARMVLEDPQAATAAYRAAQRAFADLPADQNALTEAARSLRVPGA